MTEPDTIAHWLPIYIERFGDSVNLVAFNSEADCVAAIKDALEAEKPIPETKCPTFLTDIAGVAVMLVGSTAYDTGGTDLLTSNVTFSPVPFRHFGF